MNCRPGSLLCTCADHRCWLQHALLESSATADAVKKYSKPLAAALEETQPMSTGHQVCLSTCGLYT